MTAQITPELSRPLLVDRVPNLGSHETVEATADELAAVARRLDIPAVHALHARLHAKPWRGGLQVSGTIYADVDQLSVVSLEQFTSKIEAPVERYFMPQRAEGFTAEDEIDPIDNGQIDLGELVVEALALELDPYPRLPGEQFNAPEMPDDPPKDNPFNALKRLKP